MTDKKCIYYGDCPFNYCECEEDEPFFRCPSRKIDKTLIDAIDEITITKEDNMSQETTPDDIDEGRCIATIGLNKFTHQPAIKILCKNCKYWDVSCYECDHPDNRTNAGMQPHYRSVRRCGPLFGCIFFETGDKGKNLVI